MSDQPIRAERLEAVLSGLLLPMGLRVQEIRLRGANASFDPETKQLSLEQEADLVALVTAADIAALLEKQAPGGMRGFSVSIAQGVLTVRATAKMLVLDVPALAVCRLRVDEGTKLMVELESVEVAGVGARNLVQQQLDQINPILDTTDLPFVVTMTEVMAEGDAVTIRGKARPS